MIKAIIAAAVVGIVWIANEVANEVGNYAEELNPYRPDETLAEYEEWKELQKHE